MTHHPKTPPRKKHREYPTDPAAYELLEDCGRGVSATVHRARVRGRDAGDAVVAVKRLNLESLACSLVRFGIVLSVLLCAGSWWRFGPQNRNLVVVASRRPSKEQESKTPPP